MATLKDILAAVTKLTDRVDKIDAKVDALTADVAAHRKETAAHRKETANGFEELDDELEKHSARSHRALEARIERLEKRAAPKKVSARPLRRR